MESGLSRTGWHFLDVRRFGPCLVVWTNFCESLGEFPIHNQKALDSSGPIVRQRGWVISHVSVPFPLRHRLSSFRPERHGAQQSHGG
jgi:hypothetical protein